jgi:protein ImuB
VREGRTRINPDEAPFALVEAGARGVRITAVNAQARAVGIVPGIALADARAGLPGLVSALAEPDHDRAALRKLALWCGRYGPARNVDGDDGLWVDATGVAHLFGGEEALVGDLVRRLANFGITARAGLADTLGAAFALARFATSAACSVCIAPEGRNQAVLALLPVDGLRLAPETILLLRRLGLKRIGQLYGIPRVALARRFRDATTSRRVSGQLDTMAGAVLLRLDQALGRTSEPHRLITEPPVLLARLAFAEPLISADGIESALIRLATDLCAELAAAYKGARLLILSLYLVEGSVAVVRIGTSAPARDPHHIAHLFMEKLDQVDAGFGIDLATLAAVEVEPFGAKQMAMQEMGSVDTCAAAAELIDRLSNRLGPQRVIRLVPNESHIPERAEIRISALRGSDLARPAAVPLRARPPRPPMLLSSPEPIRVIAEVPEGPPQRFVWRRVTHRVVRAEGPERIAGEWWRALRAPAPEYAEDAPLIGSLPPRDYYRLENEKGAGYWVFRQGLYTSSDSGLPRWFVHGLFG